MVLMVKEEEIIPSVVAAVVITQLYVFCSSSAFLISPFLLPMSPIHYCLSFSFIAFHRLLSLLSSFYLSSCGEDCDGGGSGGGDIIVGGESSLVVHVMVIVQRFYCCGGVVVVVVMVMGMEVVHD